MHIYLKTLRVELSLFDLILFYYRQTRARKNRFDTYCDGRRSKRHSCHDSDCDYNYCSEKETKVINPRLL